MTKSKNEIIEKLVKLSDGARNPEWERWPVHKLLSAIDDIKQTRINDVLSEDFTSRICGTIKQ